MGGIVLLHDSTHHSRKRLHKPNRRARDAETLFPRVIDGVSNRIHQVIVLFDRFFLWFFRIVAVGIKFVDRVLAGVKCEKLALVNKLSYPVNS